MKSLKLERSLELTVDFNVKRTLPPLSPDPASALVANLGTEVEILPQSIFMPNFDPIDFKHPLGKHFCIHMYLHNKH
jgi:hypothetical protein